MVKGLKMTSYSRMSERQRNEFNDQQYLAGMNREAERRVEEEWTDIEKQSRYLLKNVKVLECYAIGQDGLQALAMIKAFAKYLAKTKPKK